MWATFDDSKFPLIRVKLVGKIHNNAEFNNFITKCESYNSRREPHVFIFDSREVGNVNIKYAFKMAKVIKKIKRDEQFLKSSIIIVENRYLRVLLDLIFKLQKPVANVYMTRNADEKHIKLLHGVINGGYTYDLSQVTFVKGYKNR